MLLRAFLPYAEAQSRENIRNYSGLALVLDSRVSCQRPLLADLSADFLYANTPQLNSLTGTFAPSTSAEQVWTPVDPIPFNCTYAVGEKLLSVCALQQPLLDQLESPLIGNVAGGLISAFANTTSQAKLRKWMAGNETAFISWGTPLLLMNMSSHFYRNDPSLIHYGLNVQASYLQNYNMHNDSTLRFEKNGIYLDILSQKAPVNMSLSVCYTSWSTNRLKVNLYSDANRSEPVAKWDRIQGYYTVPDVNLQLGNTPVRDIETRGILKLAEKESWIPEPEDAIPITTMPWVQRIASMQLLSPSIGFEKMTGNVSAIWSTDSNDRVRDQTAFEIQTDVLLSQISAIAVDPTITSLFNSFMATSGSLGRTISSLITVLSSGTSPFAVKSLSVEPELTSSRFFYQWPTTTKCLNLRPRTTSPKCSLRMLCFRAHARAFGLLSLSFLFTWS